MNVHVEAMRELCTEMAKPCPRCNKNGRFLWNKFCEQCLVDMGHGEQVEDEKAEWDAAMEGE